MLHVSTYNEIIIVNVAFVKVKLVLATQVQLGFDDVSSFNNDSL